MTNVFLEKVAELDGSRVRKIRAKGEEIRQEHHDTHPGAALAGGLVGAAVSAGGYYAALRAKKRIPNKVAVGAVGTIGASVGLHAGHAHTDKKALSKSVNYQTKELNKYAAYITQKDVALRNKKEEHSANSAANAAGMGIAGGFIAGGLGKAVHDANKSTGGAISAHFKAKVSDLKNRATRSGSEVKIDKKTTVFTGGRGTEVAVKKGMNAAQSNAAKKAVSLNAIKTLAKHGGKAGLATLVGGVAAGYAGYHHETNRSANVYKGIKAQ